MQETPVQSLGWKFPWRRKWQPTPVFLPGKSYGQRSLVGYSPWGCKESDTTERLNNSNSNNTPDTIPKILNKFLSFVFLFKCCFNFSLYYFIQLIFSLMYLIFFSSLNNASILSVFHIYHPSFCIWLLFLRTQSLKV